MQACDAAPSSQDSGAFSSPEPIGAVGGGATSATYRNDGRSWPLEPISSARSVTLPASGSRRAEAGQDDVDLGLGPRARERRSGQVAGVVTAYK